MCKSVQCFSLMLATNFQKSLPKAVTFEKRKKGRSLNIGDDPRTVTVSISVKPDQSLQTVPEFHVKIISFSLVYIRSMHLNSNPNSINFGLHMEI